MVKKDFKFEVNAYIEVIFKSISDQIKKKGHPLEY